MDTEIETSDPYEPLKMPELWQGDNPYYLLISLAAANVIIDLDEKLWATKYAEYLRLKSTWFLCRKENHTIPIALNVLEGEQPYYAVKHVAIGRKTDSHETLAFGLGKKRLDGHVDRLWLINDNFVCTGDDWAAFGDRLNQMWAATTPPPAEEENAEA